MDILKVRRLMTEGEILKFSFSHFKMAMSPGEGLVHLLRGVDLSKREYYVHRGLPWDLAMSSIIRLLSNLNIHGGNIPDFRHLMSCLPHLRLKYKTANRRSR